MAEGPNPGQALPQTPATPTLKQLKKALKSVSDWHSLGIYLDLKTHQLDTIEKNHHGDDERCRTEMLNAWLNSTTTPTWEAIVEALGQMEQRRVADDIQKKYNVIISPTTIKGATTEMKQESNENASHLLTPRRADGPPALPTLPQSPVPAAEAQGDSSLKGGRRPLQPFENSMPFSTSTPKPAVAANQPPKPTIADTPVSLSQDSGIGLGSRSFICNCGKCTLEMYHNQGCPEGSFPYLITSDMSTEDRQWFESQLQCQTDEIINLFNDVATATLRSFCKRDVSVPLISMQVKNLQLKPSRCLKTIEQWFDYLANYWSWFNTRILEQLIKHCGTKEDNEQMALYLEARRGFLMRSIFSIPQNAYGEQRDENSKKLVLKLGNTVYNGNKTEAIVLDQIRTLVCATLPNQTHVELLKVKDGCLELTFQIPDQEVPSLSEKQKCKLAQEGVLSLKIEKKVYFQDISKSENEPPPDDSALCLKTTPGILRKRSASQDCTPCTSKTRRKSPRHNSSPAVYYNSDNTIRTKTVKAY